MVGRLLERFYGDLSKFNDIFTDLSKIPLFITNIPCYIPEIENDKLISDFGEVGNDSNKGDIINSNDNYHTFFYELVSNLVCSCKFKTTISPDDDQEDQDLSKESEEDSNISKEESKGVSTEEDASGHGSELMSPFFNQTDKPYVLSQEEQAILLVPTKAMFQKLFKSLNDYCETSRMVGKMYAHISWADKEFSKNYLNLLGSFILESSYYEILKKFKIPLLQVLLLEDSPSLSMLRSKIAIRCIYKQKFLACIDRYYTMGLETLDFLFYLCKSSKVFHQTIQNLRSTIAPKIEDFLKRDPISSITNTQWLPSLPMNSVSQDMIMRLVSEDFGTALWCHICDAKDALAEIYEKEQFEYMNIQQTLVRREYIKDSTLSYFSDNYSSWVNACVNQEIGNDVIFIEYENPQSSSKSPIFAFKEIIESLDKRVYGEERNSDLFTYLHQYYHILKSQG